MSGKRQKKPEEKIEVPGWIVSFSDMVTLLLAFFVLLQTFAKDQDPELFYAGQGSFRRAVAGFGMTNLLGGDPPSHRDFRSLKYPTKVKTKTSGRSRVIDEDDERIRRMFKEIKDSMDVKAADVAKASISVFSTPITFDGSSAELNQQARQCLEEFSRVLARTGRREKTKVYVIGLAADERTTRAKWLLSARRAAAAQSFLAQALNRSGAEWDIQSWGAGNGGQWRETFGLVPQRTQLAIVTMGAADSGLR